MRYAKKCKEIMISKKKPDANQACNQYYTNVQTYFENKLFVKLSIPCIS